MLDIEMLSTSELVARARSFRYVIQARDDPITVGSRGRHPFLLFGCVLHKVEDLFGDWQKLDHRLFIVRLDLFRSLLRTVRPRIGRLAWLFVNKGLDP